MHEPPDSAVSDLPRDSSVQAEWLTASFRGYTTTIRLIGLGYRNVGTHLSVATARVVKA